VKEPRVERDAVLLDRCGGGAEPVHYGADAAHHDVHTHSEDRSAETFGRLFERNPGVNE
jgi:hypothetical protein